MTDLVVWDDTLSVGIEEIDQQHKILVKLVNQMHNAIEQKEASSVVKPILDKLIQYTIIHFAVEESLMRIFHYPGYEEHKEHHEELTREVIDLHRKVRTGEAHINFQLMHFLQGWLTHHILQEDMEYSDFFLERGIQASWKKKSWLERLWGSD